MATPAHTTQTWRFGIFEVDAQGESLRRAGLPIKLREQSFRILVFLLEHAGELVTREDLRKVLWPAGTFVDFDHSLNTAVMKLREALGDTADKPLYIETVPKRGYRLVAPVSLVIDQQREMDRPGPVISRENDESTTMQGVAKSVTMVRGRHIVNYVVVLGSVLLVAIASFVFIRLHHFEFPGDAGSEAAPNYRIIPVTSALGSAVSPAISRDGRAVVYAWNGTEQHVHFDIYAQLIGSDTPLRLTNLKSGLAGNPTWSPDGSMIAFTWCEGRDGAVYVLPALGGKERKLASVGCQYDMPEPLAWFADSTRILMIDRCSASGLFGVVVFSLETGEKKCLTDFGPTGFQRRYSYALSPDESTVAFNPSGEEPDCAIYTVPVSGGTPHRIVKDERRPCDRVMWTPDGSAIVFRSQRTTSLSLWRVPEAGGRIKPETVYPALGSYSQDGRRFVYSEPVNAEPLSIWRAELAGPGGKILSNKSFISTHFGDLDAQPSPDGTRLAWMSYRSGPAEIWMSNSTGESPVQLTHRNLYCGSPRWSPDGKRIAFDCDMSDGTQLFVIDAEGTNLKAISEGPFQNAVPSWSRDGKSIYFASNRTGRHEVWKKSLQDGNESQLSTHGGFNAFESFDGRTVYFSKFDEAGIWSVPSKGGVESIVVEGRPQVLYWGHWALTQTGIYVLNADAEPKGRIEFYDFATRRTWPVLSLERRPAYLQPSLSATPDGKALFYTQMDRQSVIKMMEFSK